MRKELDLSFEVKEGLGVSFDTKSAAAVVKREWKKEVFFCEVDIMFDMIIDKEKEFSKKLNALDGNIRKPGLLIRLYDENGVIQKAATQTIRQDISIQKIVAFKTNVLCFSDKKIKSVTVSPICIFV